jgi:RimJ/RimL family protein N-acetyltransferase
MPILSTPRLRLEPLQPQHAAEMFPLLQDSAIYRYLDYGPPASEQALQALYARLARGSSADGTEVWLNWLVRLQGGAALGYVQATVVPGNKAWVAYVLAPEHWGRGYAFEAMHALLSHLAADHPVGSWRAVIEERNERSARLLQRLGFEPAPALQAAAADLTPTERLYVRRATLPIVAG